MHIKSVKHLAFAAWVVVAVLGAGAVRAAAVSEHWVATWAAAMQGMAAWTVGPVTPVQTVSNQTVRQALTISIGGPRLRVFLSNEFGDKPLVIGAASVAISDVDGKPRPGSIVRLTFNGRNDVRIPPGVRILSDAVNFKTEALQNIAVSLYLPQETVLNTLHSEDLQGTSPRGQLATGARISTAGDFTAAADMPLVLADQHLLPPFLSQVQVTASRATPVVVILGDTKSEGPGFWPNFLRDRLAPRGIAVANVSQYAGTLYLHRPEGTGLSRFDANVPAMAGATHVFLFNASNDINMPGMAREGQYVMHPATKIPVDEIIFGLKQVIERSHAAGLKVIGATLIPFEGVEREGYASPEHLRMRDEVNQWIRSSGAFDAVVDFDAVIRDPAHPQRILPAYDAGNHFTPSEAGSRALAAAIQEALFRER
jgi:lysophospholipase L1-like esterase